MVFAFAFIISSLFVISRIESEYIDKLDFKSFYTGAKLVAENPARLYDLDLQRQVQEGLIGTEAIFLPFKSPPVISLLYLPLLIFDLYSAYFVFVIAGFFAVAALNYFLIKQFGLEEVWKHLFLSTVFLPNLLGIYNGQAIFIHYALFILIYFLSQRKQHFKTGLATGLLFVKPQFLLITPFVLFMQKNKTRFVLGFLLSLGVLLGASIFAVPNFLYNYSNLIVSTESSLYGSDPTIMATLNAFLLKFMDTRQSLLINALLYLAVLSNYTVKAKSMTNDIKMVIAVFFGLLFAIHAWDHDLVLLLLPYFILLNRVGAKQRTYLSLCMLISPFLLFSTDSASLVSVLLLFAGLILINFDLKLKQAN